MIVPFPATQDSGVRIQAFPTGGHRIPNPENPFLESAAVSGYNKAGYLAHILWPGNCCI
jgi:hypothetical protein